MQKIEAFIKEHRLETVVLAFHEIEGATGMTVTDARGFGRGRGAHRHERGQAELGDFLATAKVEVFCADALAETVVQAIERAAHTGLRGDGKIYVIPVAEAVRISTGERGERAV